MSFAVAKYTTLFGSSDLGAKVIIWLIGKVLLFALSTFGSLFLCFSLFNQSLNNLILFTNTRLWALKIHQKFTMGHRKGHDVAHIQNLGAHCTKTIGNK